MDRWRYLAILAVTAVFLSGCNPFAGSTRLDSDRKRCLDREVAGSDGPIGPDLQPERHADGARYSWAVADGEYGSVIRYARDSDARAAIERVREDDPEDRADPVIRYGNYVYSPLNEEIDEDVVACLEPEDERVG